MLLFKIFIFTSAFENLSHIFYDCNRERGINNRINLIKHFEKNISLLKQKRRYQGVFTLIQSLFKYLQKGKYSQISFQSKILLRENVLKKDKSLQKKYFALLLA